MEETEEKSDSSSESESGSNASPVPEPSIHSKSEDTEGTSTSSTGKRKLNDSCSTTKKKGVSSKDGRSLSLSMPGPSSSKAKWSSSSSSEREECPVCRKQLGRKPIAVPDCCNHSFCYECISAWVTKAKSNCPMDRKDIKLLKVYDKGKLITTEAVEPKVPEEEEVGPEDEGEICPDCGWIGIRPSIGICLHCMFHHDHPWPVEDCPQCMEAESNASDEEWEPATTSRARRRIPSESSAIEMASSEDESAIFTSESEGDDEDDEEENISEIEEAECKTPVATTSVRRAPVRRKTKRRVVKKKRRKTTTKRKTTARRKTATQRKRKTKQRTAASATKRKRKTKSTARRTRKKRKISIKTRRKQARRRIAPSDSAKARLAKLLGLRPPKDPRQLIPRGCKPRPVTSAQIAAASASTSSIVNSRPVGSIDYHHSQVPTFHLFGGDELEYFPSDSDSERGGGDGSGSVIASRQMHSLSSEIRTARRLSRQKVISIAIPRSAPSASFTHIQPSEPVDLLGSILESQTLMRSRFDIRQDGSISINSTKNNSTGIQPAAQSPRLNLEKADNLATQRPSSPSSNDPKTPSTVPDNGSTSSSVQINNDQTEEVCQDSTVSVSNSNQNPHESSYQEQSVVNCNNSPSSGGSKHKSSPTSQDDDEEIDIYSDIPSSEIPRDEEPSPPASPKLPQSPAIDAEQFDTSMASFATNESEGEDDPEEEEEEEGNERMIIDETDAAIQSPPAVPAAAEERLDETCEAGTSQLSQAPNMLQQVTSAMERSPCYGGDSSTLYGSSSPCYGGGSPKYTAADSVETQVHYQSELYSGLPTPAEVCPNLFTYSAASMELARNCGVEEEENEKVPAASSEVSPMGSPVSPKVATANTIDSENKFNTNAVSGTVNGNSGSKRKSIEKTNRRQSLVEEIFGSDSEGEDPTNDNAFSTPAVPSAYHPISIQMTGLEGLDTETISETEEEANFNDLEDDTERLNSTGIPPQYSATLKPTASGKTEADYEEGEIVEDRPRNYTETVINVFVAVQTNDSLASAIPSTIVATSPVSPDPCMVDNLDTFKHNTPRSPIAVTDQPPSRPLSDNRKRDKSPERRRGRENRSKKSSKKSESDKLNSNIEWKKLSKSTKERNYRDGKAKENVSYERGEKKEKSNREDRRSKKKKEKRKDLERYDVRKVINERTRREAERRRRDKFGRDISRERSHSQSPSHSPHNAQHHQPRNRRRTPETDYQGARNRGRHYRNDSWSSNHSNHSRYSMSGSSHASSPRVGHHSGNRHRHNHREEEKNRELSGERHRARGRSMSRSPSRSHSREMARRGRKDPSLTYKQPTAGMVTIVSGHERLTSQCMKNSHLHQMPSSQLNDSVITASMLSAANNAANKKKVDKSKDKKKKESKKKKKEHHRHVLAPLAPASSVTNNNPPAVGVNVSSVATAEKKKRKREKSPPASKEVFASGDNILVSVNFNKPPMAMLSTAATSLTSIPKSKELASNNAANNASISVQKRIIKDNQQIIRSDGHGRPAPKRLKRDMGRKAPEHGNMACDRSPRRKNNESSRSSLLEKQQAPQQVPNRKREDGMKRRKRIAEIAAKRKPVAIIDLESSPFAERAPSPAVVITLSDNETRLSSSSQSSRRSSIDDNRRGRRRMDKEEQRPRKQRKPSKSDMKTMERQMPMTAPTLNTAPTVALGPKTPPEPQIKFSINSKPQLRSITNPLQDEDDDAEIDVVTVSGTNRDKSEIDLNSVVSAGLVTSNSGIPTLLVSSHNMPTLFRGPNTPPEPCLTQSRSSSCSTTTKLDNETSKGDAHIPQSPVDAKSPDVYDPFEPTKSPSSDASSLEQPPDISQPNTDDLLEEVNDSIGNAAALTPGSMSDNSENSSRLIPQVPESPTPENIVDHPKHQTLHEEDIKRKDEAISNKTENVVPLSIRPHHNISQVEDQQTRSPVQAVTVVSASETADTTEMKPTSTTTIILPPPVAGAQELFTTLPPNVASILCAQQHQGLFRPPLNATIATVPILLSTPSLLGLRVSQHAILAASQQPLATQQQQQHAQQQQQQPDTTTTTDVVDMELESPYSPASSEGDDLFEPPDKPPSPTYLPRNEKQTAKANTRLSHQKRNTTDKFDALFNQSTPLKKEASSTSGNRGARSKGTHGHRSTKGRHNRADKSDNKTSKVGSTQKSRSKNANSNEKNKTKKEISIKMDEDQLKILDDLPSSAVEMQVKEKFLKKLNRQERVVEEVKLALKPHYTKKLVNKEEYKEILRRSVPKICHNKTGEINPIRIRFLVEEYVKKFRYLKKKDSTRSRGKADKQRKNT